MAHSSVGIFSTEQGPLAEIMYCPNPRCDLHKRPRRVPSNRLCVFCGTYLPRPRPPSLFFVPPAGERAEISLAPSSPVRPNSSDIVEKIGQRILELREANGFAQHSLSKISGTSRSYLSRIERGKMTPSLGTLEKLAAALEVGLSRVFALPGDPDIIIRDNFLMELRPFLGQVRRSWILTAVYVQVENPLPRKLTDTADCWRNQVAPDVGALIRRKRKRLGWSQPQLATKVGCDAQSISLVERTPGRIPRRETLEKIAKALGVSLAIFLRYGKSSK